MLHYHIGGKVQSCSRVMLDIIHNEGPRHLMKGLLPRLIAVPSMMSVFYVINEELERIFLGTTLV
jgi:solute carrier family 25 aspartate/glutamate transporter 12/13/solute carrier family 25 carnitine/acylcarnitine transporter 20/29